MVFQKQIWACQASMAELDKQIKLIQRPSRAKVNDEPYFEPGWSQEPGPR